jgi:hypothetical protein
MSKSYTWVGANGGSWSASSNWNDGSGHSTGSPGSTDFAQFVGFDGKVTGAVGADTLDVGPGSALTLAGSGFFSQVNVGQDVNFNVGAATLAVGSGDVVAATLLDLGTPLGGTGTLKVAGTFSTSGGIVMDQTAVADTIIVNDGGKLHDGASLTMADGGLIQVGATGRMVIGSVPGGGVDGALNIEKNFTFFGEGKIAASVIVNGSLQTFNGGFPARKLTVNGSVTGTGSVSVVQELDLYGAVGAGVKISLFGNGGSNAGELRLAHAFSDQGVLATMSTHSVIALTGLQFSSVHWASGFLIATGASGTLKLKTSGDHSHQTFAVRADPISGTDIVVTGTTAAMMGANIRGSSPATSEGRGGALVDPHVAGFAQTMAGLSAHDAASLAPLLDGRTSPLAPLFGSAGSRASAIH